MGKKASKRPLKTETKDSGDWITALAKKAATQDASAALLSKAERIERRNAKKRRRQERNPSTANAYTKNSHTEYEPEYYKRVNRLSAARLKSLAKKLEQRVATLQDMTTYRSRPYQCEVVKKGKATSGNQLSDEIIQPRRRDYGGLGFARPSIFISLRDPSFVPKLEEEFAEHVPGFFGKQKTKAMKKQLDGNMLWRQLAEKRADNRKFGGKKLSEMSADERVEAVIKAGMI